MELVAGVGVLLTAGILGVTHGLEPDHAAGILSLADESSNARFGAIVGACFALGHVLLIGVWIGVAEVLFGSSSIPGFVAEFGTVVLGAALLVLGGTMGLLAGRTFVHGHEHSHGKEGVHRHYHAHLPFRSDPHAAESPAHEHDHSVRSYLKVGVVGALFTLSPPLSMLAFVSVVLADSGAESLLFVVGAYAIAIVLTMASVGGGVGIAFARTRQRGTQVYTSARLLAGVLVFAYGWYFLWQSVRL